MATATGNVHDSDATSGDGRGRPLSRARWAQLTNAVLVAVVIAACSESPTNQPIRSLQPGPSQELPHALLAWGSVGSSESSRFVIDGHGADLSIVWDFNTTLLSHCFFLMRLNRTGGGVGDDIVEEWGWSLSQEGPTATPRPTHGEEDVFINDVYSGSSFRYWISVGSCPEGSYSVTVTRVQ